MNSRAHSPATASLSSRWAARPARLRALLLAVTLVVPLLTGCNPVGTTVQAFLQPLRDQVNAVIDKAGQTGDELLLTAAGQVDLALSNAVSAYATELDQTVDKLDDTARANLDHLRTIVADLQTGADVLVRSTIDGSQQVLNSLPFTNKNPQVRSWSPHVTAAGGSGTVPVSVLGNFLYATQKNLPVSLVAVGATYQPSAIVTSEMSFSVPAGVFATEGQRPRLVELSLTIPCEHGTIIKTTKPGQFRLLVTVVPARPLTELSVTTDVPRSSTFTQSLIAPPGASTAGGGWRVQSWSSCAPRDDHHVVSATIGWSIVPASVTVRYSARGVEPRGQASTSTVQPTGFQVSGHTDPNCFLGISDGSGDITYFVAYLETRTVVDKLPSTVDLMAAPYSPLGWGERISVPVTRHAWTVHARLWNGKLVETSSELSAGATGGNGYLSVKDDGDRVTIDVAATSALSVAP